MNSVLQALAITPHDPSAMTLPEVEALDHIISLADLHKKLEEHDWLLTATSCFERERRWPQDDHPQGHAS